MSALNWFGDLLSHIASIVPRLTLIRSTHAGVRFRLGSASSLKPGLRFWWPLIDELAVICVVRQTLNLSYQTLITRDGHQVTVSVVIVFEIDDPLKALTQTDNLMDTIQDLAHSAIKRIVSCNDREHLQAGLDHREKNIDLVMKNRMRRDLAPYGVHVQKAFISDLACPLVIRLLGDGVLVN